MKDKIPSRFAWSIVGFCFITLALVYGVYYSFSVFFVALLKEFGWSRSIGAGAFSLFMIVSCLIGPFVGNMISAPNPRRVILGGILILGIGLALCSLTQTWWQFYIFFSLIAGVGLGATGWLPNVIIIQQWFKEKRGLATGIISAGIGTGILVSVPSAQYLILRLGWRMAYRTMAIFIPLIVISMTITFLKRPPPAPSHLLEMELAREVKRDPSVINREWASQSWTLAQASTTKTFWLLGLSFFLANSVTQTIFTHQVAFFVDRGLEALLASYIVGMIGMVSLGGKILWGTLSDKIGREITYTLGITCSIFGMLLLILFDLVSSSRFLYLYAAFFGMGYAVHAALPPLITADFFEGQGYGRIFGVFMIFIGIGGAFGAWFAGFLFDYLGSYVPVFIILIVCAFFSCLSIWWAAPRKIRAVPGKRMKSKE
jgi:MFS family permease